ncbi:Ubiquitin-conjugating enzyme, E2 [Corchorus capsularis]|uniref:Ubiquitin-conjugating enzyme, E2 n=1 Tax=Corchorus capsularis TaxID=210143 RepID=A0A1R3FWQ7_COCAP|nr:Ubiquitin-conjugating enzyme, E2 [Corchorus capsularis]
MEATKEIEEIVDDVEEKFSGFKKFDILPITVFHDHYFFPYLYPINEIFRRKSLEKIMKQELKTLEQSLPNWIFVRGYDSKGRGVDLIRAAIAGLENTPYRYGFFFFDILIPYDYPSKPPQLFYHSWVQEECVPSTSSRSRHELKEKKKAAVIFKQTCETMLSIMEKPPQDFGDFVAGYFRKWSNRILLCCKEEMQKHNSVMDLLFFLKLLKAFEANGSYCRHHYDHKIKSLIMNMDKDTERERVDETFLEKLTTMLFKYMG